MKNFLLLLSISFISSISFSQEWKRYADSAAIYKSSDYNKAAEFYLLAKNNIPVDSLETLTYGLMNFNLGRVYYNAGKYEKAELFYLEDKKITEKILGKENLDYAYSCNNLGTLYLEMRLYRKAEPFFLECSRVFEKLVGKEDVDYANTCNSLAVLYRKIGEYGKAKIFNLEALQIREKILGKEDVDYAFSCNSLALLYQESGLYENSEPLFIETKNIIEKLLGKGDQGYATLCNNLAALYKDMGQYEKAEPFYLEAKQIREKNPGKEHPDYATSCNNLALLYEKMGQYEKAELLYFESKIIYEKALGNEHIDYAALCNNLAGLYSRRGLYEKAEPLYLKAKGIREKLLGKDHPQYSASCNNLALLYSKMGLLEKALPLQLEDKKISEKIHGKEHPDYATSCNNLAFLYKAIGQYEKAELLYLEAKKIREKIQGKEHPDYAVTNNNLAELYWLLNKNIKADSLYREGFDLEYKQMDKIFRFTGEGEKQKFLKNIFTSANQYQSFYYQSFPHQNAAQPYSISFLTRNLTLASGSQLKKAVFNSRNETAIKDFDKWMGIKKQLASLYTKGQGNTNYFKELEDSANTTEKLLSRNFSDLKDKKNILWTGIQNNLKEGETAIEFTEFHYYTGKRWTDSTYYIALVLRKDKPEPILVPLFEKRQLDSILLQTGNKTTNDNVKNLYTSRGVEGDDAVVLNKSLYKLIWGPLEKELNGVNTVYFAPAGLLHRIAFAALPINDKEVLSDKYKLVTLSTPANIVDQQTFYVSSTDKINLYGGIKYNVDTTALKKIAIAYHIEKSTTRSLPDDLTRGASWNDLPGTKKETDGILSVANNKNNISVLSGIQATEESIKALDGKNSPVVLHIATHGFFFPDPKQDKKDDLKTSSESGKAFKQSDDPLFRSGLLFAGANTAWSGKAIDGIEDGILTSYEVSNMYLPNTKLVVLSACETGLGDIQGAEGVYGLQRAFKMAGAENLIMSLWKVPDAETAEFMQQLYKNIFAKQSISDAFYNAQTTLKNKYRSDPYKWAAWVMVR